MMIKVSDAIGNSFVTDSQDLAEKIVVENNNPFIRFELEEKDVAEKDIVKTYDDFCNHFY